MEDERGKEEKAMIVKITEINGLGDEGSNMDIAQNCWFFLFLFFPPIFCLIFTQGLLHQTGEEKTDGTS